MNGNMHDRCTDKDYRELFASSATQLHWLCYSLIGDEELSEKVLKAALEQSLKGAGQVFREWMVSWARRSIIQACISLVSPTRAAPARLCQCLQSREDGGLGISDRLSFARVIMLTRSSRDSCISTRSLGLFSCCRALEGYSRRRQHFY